MHTPLTEQQEEQRGRLIAEVLGLKHSRDYPERYDTTWGNKTAIGLFRTMKRIIEEGA